MKESRYRYRATLANKDRLLAKVLFQSRCRRLHRLRIWHDHDAFATEDFIDLHFYACWSQFFNPPLEEHKCLFRLHIRRQAQTDLSLVDSWNNHLGPLTSKAANNTVHFKRRTRPYVLYRRIFCLPGKLRNAHLLEQQPVDMHHILVPEFQFLRCRPAHLVIETRNMNVLPGVLPSRNNYSQGM